MSVKRKLLLIGSALCYAVVLLSFLISNYWFMLVFFILHSVCLVTFALLSAPTKEGSIETEMLKAQLNDIQKKYDALSKEKEELASAQASEKERFCLSLEEVTTSRDNAFNEIENLQKELTTLKEQENASNKQLQDHLEDFLPPINSDDMENQTIDIIATARDTVTELLPFAEKANLQITINAPEDSLLVKASRTRIQIMFRNIIDNSIKYMNRAGLLVITVSSLGDDIFIVLKDNGNGLPVNETEHIFELNYQGSNRISGNGLGLTQAKAIVTYYGGTIYAKSTPGKGMGIYVQLPTN